MLEAENVVLEGLVGLQGGATLVVGVGAKVLVELLHQGQLGDFTRADALLVELADHSVFLHETKKEKEKKKLSLVSKKEKTGEKGRKLF